MKILVIDNYDSFTYNLVHAFKQISDISVTVKRNDELNLDEIVNFDKLVLSPGPGIPEEAGQMPELIHRFAGKIPMLGVCLGHQAIAENFGARLENMSRVLHGVSTTMKKTGQSYLFENLPDSFQAGRYHSWIVREDSLPQCLEVICRDENGQIMGIRHKEYDILGVQFHPESVLTPEGQKMIENWIRH